MIKGRFINTITVIDPDTNNPVKVDIYKLETGGMIGIDTSYLETTDEPVYSPFDLGVEIDLEGW